MAINNSLAGFSRFHHNSAPVTEDVLRRSCELRLIQSILLRGVVSWIARNGPSWNRMKAVHPTTALKAAENGKSAEALLARVTKLRVPRLTWANAAIATRVRECSR